MIFSLLAAFFLTHSAHAICPGGKTYEVSLTFDDGPHPKNTALVLDALKRHNLHGTFFVLGEHIDGGKSSFPAATSLLKRIVAEGHVLGTHTYSHKSHTCGGRLAGRFTPEQAKQNLDRTYGGQQNLFNSHYFRFPYGRGWLFDPKCPSLRGPIMAYAQKMGLEHVGWDVDSQDYMTNPPFRRPARVVIPRLLRSICTEQGGVILFHDINKFTSHNIDAIIEAIQKDGHKIVDLDKIPRTRKSFDPAPGGGRVRSSRGREKEAVR